MRKYFKPVKLHNIRFENEKKGMYKLWKPIKLRNILRRKLLKAEIVNERVLSVSNRVNSYSSCERERALEREGLSWFGS